MSSVDDVKFNDQGLVPVIAQDAKSNEVLMLAYMNKETLQETLDTGNMVYYSRSRQTRWRKGETSGHLQTVQSAHLDCDGDTLLFKIHQEGGACHKGYVSCFFRTREDDAWNITGKKIEE
ncbi:MAG: phosphoribosyl-AMP cyclohydrolase [Chitinivibrionales bacterium]|nr:phosphoribosyl-AMP cyclohydrolase [Chitinivibrionales bacterium]